MFVQLSLLQLDVNNFWMLFGVVLVFVMQVGFTMLEVGTVEAKHTKNILLKNVIDAAIITICWWSFGHSVAFGGSFFNTHPLPLVKIGQLEEIDITKLNSDVDTPSVRDCSILLRSLAQECQN